MIVLKAKKVSSLTKNRKNGTFQLKYSYNLLQHKKIIKNNVQM